MDAAASGRRKLPRTPLGSKAATQKSRYGSTTIFFLSPGAYSRAVFPALALSSLLLDQS